MTEPALPPDIRMPTWSSTADLVTARFAQFEMYYEQPPHARNGRDRRHSSATPHDDNTPCEFCGRHAVDDLDGYERRHRRSRAVVRAHEDCGSDLELPKYSEYSRASLLPSGLTPSLAPHIIMPPPDHRRRLPPTSHTSGTRIRPRTGPRGAGRPRSHCGRRRGRRGRSRARKGGAREGARRAPACKCIKPRWY